jgi:hypothetical protein
VNRGKALPARCYGHQFIARRWPGFFLYLALARHEPLYSIGIFAMFVLYLAIRIYSARRISGIMPRILGQYEPRIAELEARLHKIEGDKSTPTEKEPTA